MLELGQGYGDQKAEEREVSRLMSLEGWWEEGGHGGKEEEDHQSTAAQWSGSGNQDFHIMILTAFRNVLRVSLLFPHIKSAC